MADRMPVTEEMRAEWEAWKAEKPPHVREVAERFPPWKLYRLNGGGRVWVMSFGETDDDSVTLTVAVTGHYNRVLFGRQVFGVEPADLVECDLPAPGEDVGDTAQEAGYTEEDVERILIPKLRADMIARGVLNPDGTRKT